ncbi:hypothetical protein IE53DRAFT_14976 [Violaceomyces palustris]|uniref:Uncharacterized protein n=1 Tax=Violaceomyces palustris TaxID=1673888 RepID=A0ACD0P7Z3_9BASI|nr:hypothetical protein IE53DRAFT_14976 [Violaceomyces palustris]
MSTFCFTVSNRTGVLILSPITLLTTLASAAVQLFILLEYGQGQGIAFKVLHILYAGFFLVFSAQLAFIFIGTLKTKKRPVDIYSIAMWIALVFFGILSIAVLSFQYAESNDFTDRCVLRLNNQDGTVLTPILADGHQGGNLAKCQNRSTISGTLTISFFIIDLILITYLSYTLHLYKRQLQQHQSLRYSKRSSLSPSPNGQIGASSSNLGEESEKGDEAYLYSFGPSPPSIASASLTSFKVAGREWEVADDGSPLLKKTDFAIPRSALDQASRNYFPLSRVVRNEAKVKESSRTCYPTNEAAKTESEKVHQSQIDGCTKSIVYDDEESFYGESSATSYRDGWTEAEGGENDEGYSDPNLPTRGESKSERTAPSLSLSS